MLTKKLSNIQENPSYVNGDRIIAAKNTWTNATLSPPNWTDFEDP